MKCATEMIISTYEDRMTASARAEAEAERQRRLEEEKRKQIAEKAMKNATLITENILRDFEKQFRNWGGDPLEFIMQVKIDNITNKYPGCGLGNWYKNHDYYYLFKATNCHYADGRISYDTDLNYPVDLTMIINTLTDLCYKVVAPSQDWSHKYHFGSGEIFIPSFGLTLDPQCIEKK